MKCFYKLLLIRCKVFKNAVFEVFVNPYPFFFMKLFFQASFFFLISSPLFSFLFLLHFLKAFPFSLKTSGSEIILFFIF